MIRLQGYLVLTTTGGTKKLAGGTNIESWPNDYFDDKFDIFDEKEWAKFIINYRKFGKKLPKVDENGDYRMYCVVAHGASRHMKTIMGLQGRQPSFFLFPQVLHMDRDNKVQPMLDYNRKYIWPHL